MKAGNASNSFQIFFAAPTLLSQQYAPHVVRASLAAALVFALFSPASAQISRRSPSLDRLQFDLPTPVSSQNLSWRANDQKLHLIVHPGHHADKVTADVQIWVLGNSAQRPHLAGEKTAAPLGIGKIAYTQPLGQISPSGTQFAINFSNFAPRISTMVTFSPATGSSSTGIADQLAQASTEEARKLARAAILQNGTVTYKIQVVTSDGAASGVATVEFGEQNLAKSATPAFEYLSNHGTPEFPEQTWSSSVNIDIALGQSAYTFRWSPPQGATSALIQAYKKSEETPWPEWAFAKTILSQPVALTGGGSQQFTLDLTALRKAADGAGYILRIVPLADPLTLASLPAEMPVTISNSTPKPAGATLKFSYEMVGWSPGYEGASDDAYRFVVVDSVYANTKEIRDIVGGPVVEGSKVYLPPAPPEKEKAWYEKVVNSIKAVLSFISKEFDIINMLVSELKEYVAEAPFSLAKDIGVPKSIADGAFKTVSTSLNFAEDPLHVREKIDQGTDYVANGILDEAGIKDPTARMLAKGKVVASLRKWADSYQWSSSNSKVFGLAPDPDYVVRTGVVYVKVTAKATGALPAGFRMKGPSITFEAGTMAQNTELLGTKPEYFPLYIGSTAPPTLADGESVIVPVITKYTSNKTSRPADWKFGFVYALSGRYYLNGNYVPTKNSIHEFWGTVKK